MKFFNRCAFNINTLEALMRIAMTKISMDSLDFEDIWNKWISVNNRKL